ncbi:MAG: OmpA family protein [Gemmatimonadota bacterium]
MLDLRIDRLQHIAENIKEKMSKVPMLDSLKGHIELTMTHEGLRIELLEDSTAKFFESGRAVLSERGRVLVSLIGQTLAQDSNQVMVEGHTDARPYNGAAGYTNWELSADRANAARRVLSEAGLSSNQVSEVRGFADKHLRYPGDPNDPRNRRVTITLLLDRSLGVGDLPADSVKKVMERKR